jgi:hypothetical protein
MGSSAGKSITLCICGTLLLVCSCEKHQPGEYPEVQRDRAAEQEPVAAGTTETTAPSPTPMAKPTPAEFFPTKP